MACIYKITSPSGKVYIGQSRKIKDRFRKYRNLLCKGQRKLLHSLKKYGSKNHSMEVICSLPEDLDQRILNRYEAIYFQCYKDCGIEMLNLKVPDETGNGIVSDETRARMSHSAKKRIRGKHSEETKQKIRIRQIGKAVSKETVEKIRRAKTGRKCSGAFREKRRLYMLGRKTKLGKPNTPEQNKLVSLRQRGEGTHLAKLKESDVIQIKQMLRSGVSIIDINKQYPFVKKYNLYHIKNGITWKHIA